MTRRSILFCSLLACQLSASAYAESLQEAVTYAIQTNPDVLISASNRLASNQILAESRGRYYPKIDLTGAAGKERSRNPTTENLPSGPETTFTRYESQLLAVENIFAGFKNVNDVARDTALVGSAAFEVNSTAQDVALKVSQSYLDVLRSQRIVKLAQNNLKRHEHIFDMIRQRREAGLSDEADLAQAKARLAFAHKNLIGEQGNLEIAKTNYLQTVGKVPSALVMPEIKDVYIPKAENIVTELALQNNPKIKATKEDVIAAQKEHDASKSTNYPIIDLELSTGRNKNFDGIAGAYNSDAAMVRGFYNLYNGGSDLARQRETAYLVQSAWEAKNRTEREVRQMAQSSWIAYATSRDQIPYLKEHKVASHDTTILYQKQYRVGQRTLLDLLDSQNEYYNSSIAYVNGLFTELYGKYRILNNTGNLVEALEVHLPEEAYV